MKVTVLLNLLLAVFAVQSCGRRTGEQRLNQIQMIASHNSYKQAIDPRLFEIVKKKDSGALALDYHHITLQQQLALGLRGLEIDVLHDPSGGRYQYPRGIVWAKAAGIELPAHDRAGVLAKPGFKVLHEPDIDFKTSCLTLKTCLREIKAWSERHPGHSLIIITINTKDSGLEEPGATKVLPFNAATLDSLDAEILGVFSMKKLITPAAVKGSALTLKDAVLANGWPVLQEANGKILFVLDSPVEITKRYQAGKKQRPMFVNVPEEDDDASFFILNEPIEQQRQIASLVRKGFMVRTRADADTREGRTNDYRRWEAALASGAQVISTDYYLADLSPSGKFEISFSKGTYLRCNPITYFSGCPPSK